VKRAVEMGSHDVMHILSFVKIGSGIRPPLWSSGQSSWLLTQRSRVRFLALPDFPTRNGSGAGSTQPL
jgi:hypothetical protein